RPPTISQTIKLIMEGVLSKDIEGLRAATPSRLASERGRQMACRRRAVSGPRKRGNSCHAAVSPAAAERAFLAGTRIAGPYVHDPFRAARFHAPRSAGAGRGTLPALRREQRRRLLARRPAEQQA